MIALYVVLSCFITLCLSQGFDTPIDIGTLTPPSGTGTYEIGCYSSGSRCIYTVIVKLYDPFLILYSETRLECNTTCSSGGSCVFNDSCPVCLENINSNTGSFLVERNCAEFTACGEPKSNCTADLIGNLPAAPTVPPTPAPTIPPTLAPTRQPTSLSPTTTPTLAPTILPTALPTLSPTNAPTTLVPTVLPTLSPTRQPTSLSPTTTPTLASTILPTALPTALPTLSPTNAPATLVPTVLPTLLPTRQPTSLSPTATPTLAPTILPTTLPTLSPTRQPTIAPTVALTPQPTALETTNAPTLVPTISECNLCTFTRGGYKRQQCNRRRVPTCEVAKTMWRTLEPGCLLEACFRCPIVIGDSPGFTARFTTIKAITRFLHATTTTPGIFQEDLVNPIGTPAGVFADELLTATLNAQYYGLRDVAFSTNCSRVNNRLYGMSIADLISLSDKLIAGQQSSYLSQFTPAMLSNALAVYNEAFDACVVSNRVCFVCSTPNLIESKDLGDIIETLSVTPETTRTDVFYLFLAYFAFLLLIVAIVIRTRRYRTK